jgi:predicted nucleic acid-binding protein
VSEPGWLVDKSALVRLGASPDAAAWAERIGRGCVRIATVTLLEVEHATPAAEDRAVHVLGLLADRGQHRAPSIHDLVIAAIAETAGLVVLHEDKDFELIAEVTGQEMQRLAP